MNTYEMKPAVFPTLCKPVSRFDLSIEQRLKRTIS